MGHSLTRSSRTHTVLYNNRATDPILIVGFGDALVVIAMSYHYMGLLGGVQYLDKLIDINCKGFFTTTCQTDFPNLVI